MEAGRRAVDPGLAVSQWKWPDGTEQPDRGLFDDKEKVVFSKCFAPGPLWLTLLQTPLRPLEMGADRCPLSLLLFSCSPTWTQCLHHHQSSQNVNEHFLLELNIHSFHEALMPLLRLKGVFILCQRYHNCQFPTCSSVRFYLFKKQIGIQRSLNIFSSTKWTTESNPSCYVHSMPRICGEWKAQTMLKLGHSGTLHSRNVNPCPSLLKPVGQKHHDDKKIYRFVIEISCKRFQKLCTIYMTEVWSLYSHCILRLYNSTFIELISLL